MFVWLGFANPWMLVVILALVLMIFLHELGHYLTAKRAGMKVTEFFLFFGPRLWSFRRGETEYGIKLIPAGAYVKILGMHNLEEVPPEDEGRTYRQKSFGSRLSVAVAGSAMHFMLAFVLIFVALVGVGQPGGTFDPASQDKKWLVGDVVPNSGAAEAGIRKGDKLLSIDGTPIGRFTQLKSVVTKHRGQTVPVVISRNGVRRTVDAPLREFRNEAGDTGCCLGVGPSVPVKRLSPIAGAVQTPAEFAKVTSLSVGALGKFFSLSGITNYVDQVSNANDQTATPGASNQPSSGASKQPAAKSNDNNGNGENRLLSIVGLVRIGAEAGKIDGGALIGLFALVNIFIGVINLVPLLPFDGGHVAVAVYEKIQERRLNRRRYFADLAKMLPVTYAVMLLLAMIFVSSLYLDIANPIVVK